MSTQALFDIGATTGLPGNIDFYYDVSSDGQSFVFSTVFYQQIRTPITFISIGNPCSQNVTMADGVQSEFPGRRSSGCATRSFTTTLE